MPNPTPLNALLVAILNGRYDDKLDMVVTKVFKSVKSRRAKLANEAAKNFVSGSHVRITKGNFKPRYFQGQTGTIEEIEGTVVWVRLDKPIVRKTKTIGKVGVQAIYVEETE